MTSEAEKLAVQHDLIAHWPRERRLEYFTDINDRTEAAKYVGGGVGGQAAPWDKKAYDHTAMVVGFIPATGGTAIVPMHRIQADKTLVDTRLKITLDKFHVHCYPGWGKHSVLCEFTGKSQEPDGAEELAMALRFDAVDRGGAARSGSKIFMGLKVSDDGISFKGRCINVQNSIDEAMFKVLDSPAFKSGLKLLDVSQPALKPLTSLATAVVDATIKRRRNAEVFNFELGLDFDGSATSARLALGSYVVVQTDDVTGWDWSLYEWDPSGGTVRPRSAPDAAVEYNFMVFGVSATTAVAAQQKTSRKTAATK